MRRFLSMLQAFNTGLYSLVVMFAALVIAAAVVIVTGGALTRYITGRGLSMVQELPPILIPWVVFPLAGTLLRTSTHITVDILPAFLGQNGKRYLNILLSLIAMVAGMVFCVAGVKAVSLYRLTGQVTEMEWEFPIWWIYLSFPVGFAILILTAFENLLVAILGERATETAEETEAQSYSA